MEKAHLYEAWYLVNHGIEEAVRGVQRLKKSHASICSALPSKLRRAIPQVSSDQLARRSAPYWERNNAENWLARRKTPLTGISSGFAERQTQCRFFRLPSLRPMSPAESPIV